MSSARRPSRSESQFCALLTRRRGASRSGLGESLEADGASSSLRSDAPDARHRRGADFRGIAGSGVGVTSGNAGRSSWSQHGASRRGGDRLGLLSEPSLEDRSVGMLTLVQATICLTAALVASSTTRRR